MNIKVIDAHTHVQMILPAYQDAVIKRAQDAGIGIINSGADEQSSKDAVILTHTHKATWATVGYHPHEALKSLNLEIIKELAKDEKVVGVGECGLDYFKLDSQQEEHIKQEQKKLFEFHIQLAREVQKPLVIHCRDAFTETIEILQSHKNELLPEAGILHFFTGTLNDAKQLLDLGFSFTFGGLITFNRSFDEIIKYIPTDKILAETDAPWVTPLSYKKNAFLKNEHGAAINEPVYVTEVVEWLAKIKEIKQSEMEKILLENTKRMFRLDSF
ncbi:MAG: TatD family hydrolase [Patescibacteria group bacterium]|nr:TatD family hydrolase [Patescibacteria group bacterium]